MSRSISVERITNYTQKIKEQKPILPEVRSRRFQKHKEKEVRLLRKRLSVLYENWDKLLAGYQIFAVSAITQMFSRAKAYLIRLQETENEDKFHDFSVILRDICNQLDILFTLVELEGSSDLLTEQNTVTRRRRAIQTQTLDSERSHGKDDQDMDNWQETSREQWYERAIDNTILYWLSQSEEDPILEAIEGVFESEEEILTDF